MSASAVYQAQKLARLQKEVAVLQQQVQRGISWRRFLAILCIQLIFVNCFTVLFDMATDHLSFAQAVPVTTWGKLLFQILFWSALDYYLQVVHPRKALRKKVQEVERLQTH